MKSRAGFGFLRYGLAFLLATRCFGGSLPAADTSAPPDANAKIAAAKTSDATSTDLAITNSQDAIRAYLQIQAQLHDTLLAIEKNRQAAEATAAANAEMVETRLHNMEKALATERLDSLRDIERSDRTILIAAGAFAGVGFLVLFVAAFLQWSAVKRLATATARLPSGAALQALGDGQTLPARALEQSTTRFLGVIERLEQRIHDMESAAVSRRQLPDAADGNGESKSLTKESAAETSATEPAPEKSKAVTLLLGKGQTLLKLDKPEDALGCLEEALALDPGNTDVLIKKGAALERLQRLTEAIDCYDRAIAQDNSMTMAYLYKGAVFNRMERYSEALECYEQALKTRQKGEAANIIFE